MNPIQVLPVGPAPRLIVHRVDGDLTLSGWDRPDLQVRARRSDRTTVRQHEDTVEITCADDCVIQAPLQALVKIDRVDGDAVVNMVLSLVEIGAVDGDLRVAGVGGLAIGSVDGDLSVRSVASAFKAGSVDGDARILQVAGDVQIGSVDGDLLLGEIVGNVLARTDGDAKLSLDLAPGQIVQVEADGDISCQVQAAASVKVQLAAAGDIRVKNLGESQRASHTSLDFQVGDGAASLRLKADGDIALTGVDLRASGYGRDLDMDLNEELTRRASELGEQITQQVESQVNVLTREIEDKLSRMANDEEMASRIQDKVSAALRRAEEKFAEAMRRVEARSQDVDRRTAGEDRRRKGYGAPPAPPRPAAPPKPPAVTDEERMLVLRMVEQGRISVDQAEKLLAALNGKPER